MVLLLDLEPLFDPGFLPLLLNVLDLRVLEDLLSTLFDIVRRTKDLVVEPDLVEPDLRDPLVTLLLVLLVGESKGDVALERFVLRLATVMCGEGISI